MKGSPAKHQRGMDTMTEETEQLLKRAAAYNTAYEQRRDSVQAVTTAVTTALSLDRIEAWAQDMCVKHGLSTVIGIAGDPAACPVMRYLSATAGLDTRVYPYSVVVPHDGAMNGFTTDIMLERTGAVSRLIRRIDLAFRAGDQVPALWLLDECRNLHYEMLLGGTRYAH